MASAEFEATLADRIERSHSELAARWFARLLDVLPVEARDVFPTDSLLDHIPTLILEIGAFVRDPDQCAIAANTMLLEKAAELGTLRHQQQASLHQVLREYHLLGGVLTTFVGEEVDSLGLSPGPSEMTTLQLRLQQAVDVLSQTTADTFIRLYTATISEQAQRLEEFTRLALHEWRTPLGNLRNGVAILQIAGLDHPRAEQTLATVDRSVARLVQLTNQLEQVARLGRSGDSPALQAVDVATVAREASRQLADMADARGVEVILRTDTPQLVVDVARLELTFINLISNAIKYADEQKARRYVEIAAAHLDGQQVCEITVSDNGIGIPDDALSAIFNRFTRAHTDRDDMSGTSGLGLGLSIADDCVRTMGGTIRVASQVGQGTTFTVTLPTAPTAPDAGSTGEDAAS